MSKGRKREGDPFADLKEWQEHSLDPGHFTGGRVHPVLKGRRPNRYGYVLIVGGLIAVFALGGMVRSAEFSWTILGTALSAVISIAAGVALLRKGSPARKSRSTQEGG